MGSIVLLTINHQTHIHLCCDSKTFQNLILALEEQRWAVPPCGPPDAPRSILPIYLFNHLLNYLSVASTEGDFPEHTCFLVTSSLADGELLFAGTLEIQRLKYLYIYLE